VNSIFQYPASSDDQSMAMRRTPGHMERYLTHTLCLADRGCNGVNEAPGGGPPQTGGSRRYCGGLLLRAHDAHSKSIVWNVRTDGTVIPNHNDIDGTEVIRFVAQVYGDVTGLGTDACDDDFLVSRSGGTEGSPYLGAPSSQER
jgi:hypothetical protein